jgi:hypothetical protein
MGNGSSYTICTIPLTAGEVGNDFADISTITIRNVVKGILGVAIIQGSLVGAGFMVAGVQGYGPFYAFFSNHSNWNCTGCFFQREFRSRRSLDYFTTGPLDWHGENKT